MQRRKLGWMSRGERMGERADNKTGRQTDRQTGSEKDGTLVVLVIDSGVLATCEKNRTESRKEDEANENRARKKTCLKRHLIFLHESFRVFFHPLLFLLLPVRSPIRPVAAA